MATDIAPRPAAPLISFLEQRVLGLLLDPDCRGLAPCDFSAHMGSPLAWWLHRSSARVALASLFRRGLVTRVGFGDTAVYRALPSAASAAGGGK